jgi:hypothetical protein
MKFNVKDIRNQSIYTELATSVLLLHFVFWLFSKCFYPISGPHSFRQAQTNWPVKIWSLEGFAPFRPEIPVKGPEHFTWLLEFPLFQWIVYFVHTSLNTPIDFASRLSGLCFALGTISIFAYLIHKHYRTSFSFNFLVFAVNPYFINWGTTGLIDWAAVFFGSLSALFVHRAIGSNKNIFFQITPIIFLSLGSMIKPSHAILTFCFSISIIFFTNVKKIKNQSKTIFSLILVITAGTISGLIWTDTVNRQYEITDPRHIWSLNNSTKNWYFGTKEQYQNALPETWSLINQTLQSSLGTYLFVIAIIVSMFHLKSSISSLMILVGIILYISIFINLNLIHAYYQIPVYLGLTCLILIGFAQLKSKLRNFLALPILLLYFFQISFQTSASGESSSYLEFVQSRTNVVNECPKFINLDEPILTFQAENPYSFYVCGFKAHMVNPESDVDYEVAKNYQSKFSYVFASDPSMYTKAESFYLQFGKRLVATQSNSYYRVQ